MKKVRVKGFEIGSGERLCVMTGPCVIEGEEHCLRAAEALKKMFEGRSLNLIFKSSYDKANRLSINSFRGVGVDEGLRILQRVQRELDLPVVTDVHSPEEARAAGEVCEVLQIPAFLCRQTDLVIAAAMTGRVLSVKKGQFLAPWDMKNIVEKIESCGNQGIILTDRGTTFGYNNLVTDFRCVPIMQSFGYPVCYDATHSVQLPGGLGNQSGGQREFIPVLSKAAIAAGCNCLFVEAHPDPKHAKSDASSVLDFKDMPDLLRVWERLYEVVNDDAKLLC